MKGYAVAFSAFIATANGFSISPRSKPTTRLGALQMQQKSYEEQLNAYYDQSGKSAVPPPTVTVTDIPGQLPFPLPTANPTPPTFPTQPNAVVEQPNNGLQKVVYFGVVFLGMPLWLLLSTVVFPSAFPTQQNVAAPSGSSVSMSLPSSVIPSAPTAAQSAGVVVLSQPITKAEVRNLFGLWNDALHTLDPDMVAKRYSKEGVLLPTLSDVPRNDYAAIKDYFVHFLEKKPDGKILEGEIFVGNNWAQDAGIYEFTFEDGSKVKARYSFVYVYEDGQWMISHHHSSLMPEEVVRPTAITKDEVRGLFGLWNDALATGSPQKVADRYTTDAVLLPTLSDKARYTNEGIADYFVHFLEKKPTGKILEGNVKIGPNWAQDAGIYEFTFQDGSSVQGRYSFVYSYENGAWKISNHHSSIMPEKAVAAMKKVASEVS